jgi:hypothetical protein
MGDDDTSSAAAIDAETVITVWDCSACISPLCWMGQQPVAGTEPPRCMPSTMFVPDPGPVLPPLVQ